MLKKLETALARQAGTSAYHSLRPFPLLASAHPPSSRPLQHPCSENPVRNSHYAQLSQTFPTINPDIPGPDELGEEGPDGIADRKPTGKPFLPQDEALMMPTTSPARRRMSSHPRPPTSLCLVSGCEHSTIGSRVEGSRSTHPSVHEECLCIHPPPILTLHKYIAASVPQRWGVMTSRAIIETWIVPKL